MAPKPNWRAARTDWQTGTWQTGSWQSGSWQSTAWQTSGWQTRPVAKSTEVAAEPADATSAKLRRVPGAAVRLLITGPPGIGKTTLCSKVYSHLHQVLGDESARRCNGFLSQERRNQNHKRVGFDMVSLDGSQRAPLASEDGPQTGDKVSKYHVQTPDFERLTFPILDKVLSGGDGDCTPRVLIFDEIGKMELFSSGFEDRIRRVLTSADPNLHVLGTVALQGGRFIAASKKLPGIQLLEIGQLSRDSMSTEVCTLFTDAISSTSEPASSSSAGPSSKEVHYSCIQGKEVRVRFHQPAEGEFTAPYETDAEANFASLNAGDYSLYVGGGAINQAFMKALMASGQKAKGKYMVAPRYETLHEALLAGAGADPGSLYRVHPGDAIKHPEDPTKTMLLEDELFHGITSISGLVPAGSVTDGPTMEALRPVGLVSVTTFEAGKRPCHNDHNVAMVYTVGPHCGTKRTSIQRDVDKSLSKDQFLEVVKEVGVSISTAVSSHNAHAETDNLPSIDELRVCLLSGGIFKHPAATKLDIADALIRGLTQCPPSCLLDFAFDENVFKEAWDRLQLGESGAGDRKRRWNAGAKAEPNGDAVPPHCSSSEEARLDEAAADAIAVESVAAEASTTEASNQENSASASTGSSYYPQKQ